MTRRLRLMLVLLATLLGGVAAFCWAANPYEAWRADPFAEIPRLHPLTSDEAQQRARAAYRIRLVHPQTILLGSSRVLIGMPVDDRLHEEVLNAAVSGASVDEVDALFGFGNVILPVVLVFDGDVALKLLLFKLGEEAFDIADALAVRDVVALLAPVALVL